MLHKSWDINEQDTGRFHNGKPIINATLQNGLNDIEPDGSFIPCDMGLIASDNGVTTHQITRGRFGELRFTDSASTNKHLCKIKYKSGKGVSLKYLDGDSGLPDVSNGKPVFESSNGVQLRHYPTYKGVRIELVVNDPLTAPTEYVFSVKKYGQEYTFLEEDGAIIIQGTDGQNITIMSPYAMDADGDIGTVSLELGEVVGGYQEFKKVVDETWLRQAKAPVIIDPTVTIDDDTGTFYDALLYNGLPGNNFGAFVKNSIIDYGAGNRQRVLHYVDLTAYSDIEVTDAYFGFHIFEGTFPKDVNAYPVLVPWGEGNKNGATAGTGECSWTYSAKTTTWTTGGCGSVGNDRSATLAGNVNFAAISSDQHFPVTNASLQAMIDNPSTNYGYLFESVAEAAGKFAAWYSNEAGVGNKPYLYFEYATVGGVGGLVNNGLVNNSLTRSRLI